MRKKSEKGYFSPSSRKHVHVIINSISWKNLVYVDATKRLTLKFVDHPQPYPFAWMQQEKEMIVKKKSTFHT